MVKLNKLGILCMVAVLFAAGCGKKKHTGPEKGTKKMADATSEIPLKEETENLLDDGDVADFAFVDDEKSKDGQKVAVLDEDGLEVDEDEEQSQDGHAEAYAFKNVYFGFNKNDISQDQKQVVAQDIETAKQAVEQGKKVVVEGHCDQIGSAAYNLALSQRRAQAIKAEMANAGIPADSIKTVGYGYERPVVWSDQKDRAQLVKELAPNRRAEVITN